MRAPAEVDIVPGLLVSVIPHQQYSDTIWRHFSGPTVTDIRHGDVMIVVATCDHVTATLLHLPSCRVLNIDRAWIINRTVVVGEAG